MTWSDHWLKRYCAANCRFLSRNFFTFKYENQRVYSNKVFVKQSWSVEVASCLGQVVLFDPCVKEIWAARTTTWAGKIRSKTNFKVHELIHRNSHLDCFHHGWDPSVQTFPYWSKKSLCEPGRQENSRIMKQAQLHKVLSMKSITIACLKDFRIKVGFRVRLYELQTARKTFEHIEWVRRRMWAIKSEEKE